MQLTTNVFLLAFAALAYGAAVFPSLEHRQSGSCATSPCATGLCCSQFDYCGTGTDYCQLGACTGGVGGTCSDGECCSAYGFCGTGVDFCGASSTTTTTSVTTTAATSTSTSTSATASATGYENYGSYNPYISY